MPDDDKFLPGQTFAVIGTKIQGVMTVHGKSKRPPPDFIREFEETIRSGICLERACLKHGINITTIERWMENALKGDGPCIEFFQTAMRAEVEFEQELVQLSLHGKNTTSQAARQMLKDRFPEFWAQRELAMHTKSEETKKEGPKTAVVVLPAQDGARAHVETHTIDVD